MRELRQNHHRRQPQCAPVPSKPPSTVGRHGAVRDRLFEPAQRASSGPAVAAGGAQGTPRSGAVSSGRLFFGYFLLAKQKKVPRPRDGAPLKITRAAGAEKTTPMARVRGIGVLIQVIRPSVLGFISFSPTYRAWMPFQEGGVHPIALRATKAQ